MGTAHSLLPPLPSLPTPWREMRALVSLGQGPCCVEPVSCSALCSRKCCQLHQEGAVGADRQTDRFLLYYSSLLLGDWGLWPKRRPQGKRNGRLWLLV